MIYTVTFNPAIDYVVHMKGELVPGSTNRTVSEEIYFGGKGINVSMVLQELGLETTALGFIAGFTGRAIREGVEKAGIHAQFIELPDGNSRINVKIKGEEETEINAQGPRIPGVCIDRLYEKLDEIRAGDLLVISGSIPSSLPDDIYEKILQRLSGRGIDFVVDATGKLLWNVLISMAGDGSMLLTEDGQVLRKGVCRGRVLNSVGAGDSMVAGFIAGYKRSHDYRVALDLGTAAGGATAFSEGLAKKELIERLYQTLV